MHVDRLDEPGEHPRVGGGVAGSSPADSAADVAFAPGVAGGHRGGDAPAAVMVHIPGPPQGKGRPRVGRVGGHARMFTPAKTASYEALVALAGQQAMAGREPLDGPLWVSITAAVPIPPSWSQRKQRQASDGELRPTGKPDLDNILKAVLDGLNGVVWIDDAQIVHCKAIKRYGCTPGVSLVVRRDD